MVCDRCDGCPGFAAAESVGATADDERVQPSDARDLSYLHCPFLNPADFLHAYTWLTPPPPAPVKRLPILVRSRAQQLTAGDQGALAEWEQRGFTAIERDVWLAAGLGRYESHIADQCRLLELTPAMLAGHLDGRRIAERLRSGETAASIAARLLDNTA